MREVYPGAVGKYCKHVSHRTLARYVKLWVAQAPGMPGTFSPIPRVSDPDMHHGACVTHVPWCIPGSLTSGFLWSRWRRKRSRHSRRMRNPQFFVSGKRPITSELWSPRRYPARPTQPPLSTRVHQVSVQEVVMSSWWLPSSWALNGEGHLIIIVMKNWTKARWNI